MYVAIMFSILFLLSAFILVQIGWAATFDKSIEYVDESYDFKKIPDLESLIRAENNLLSEPENYDLRNDLIRAYFFQYDSYEKSVSAAQNHIEWFIDKKPDYMKQYVEWKSFYIFDKAKQSEIIDKWRRANANNKNNINAIRNAAHFSTSIDDFFAEECFLKLYELSTYSPRTAKEICFFLDKRQLNGFSSIEANLQKLLNEKKWTERDSLILREIQRLLHLSNLTKSVHPILLRLINLIRKIISLK